MMARLRKHTRKQPPMPEKVRTVSIRVDIPSDLKNQFKAKCALSGKDMTTVLSDLIKDYVEKK
jgi:hypothetical protein